MPSASRNSGVVSLAHPGVTHRDDMIATWADGGLDALEAFHSDHDRESQSRYLAAADALGLAVSGGSDFHGDDPGSTRFRRRIVGGVPLPAEHFAGLAGVHAERQVARHA